jgi:ABC-type amino acid transport substrate-binding protein
VRRAFAALALLAATCGVARAEEGDLLTGTLQAISSRGSIRIGYRETAPPFSFLNKAGQPIGFSIDICRQIAADVAQTLNRTLLEPDAEKWQSGIRITLVPVAADARVAKLVAGEIDVECGSTTANAERAKSVAFSPVIFLAGTRLLVDAKSPVQSYRDLAGKRVVVGAGTTNAQVMQRLAGSVSPPIGLEEVANLGVAFDSLAAGKADGFASDDILLTGLLATRADHTKFKLIGDYLSFEPYAIAFRRDDAGFGQLVRASFARMAADGVLKSSYARWFTSRLPNGENLNLPMSPHLTEMFRGLGQPD